MKHRVIIEFEDQKAWEIWAERYSDKDICGMIELITKCRPGGTVRIEHEEEKK